MAVTGVDITPSYLEQARSDPLLSPQSVLYVEGDLRHLPVEGPYDAVVCWLNSFGYYDDADCHRVLAEFHRVLRPGGTVAIDTMHHDGGVRHFTPAPDAVVVHRGDDTMVELSTFDPVSGRMCIERTVHRDGAVRRASVLRAPPDPARMGRVAGGGRLSRRAVPGRRRWPARARQLGDGGGRDGLRRRGREAVRGTAGTDPLGWGGRPPEGQDRGRLM